MIDGGSGNLKDCVDNLYKNYVMICVQMGLKEILKHKELEYIVVNGYKKRHSIREVAELRAEQKNLKEYSMTQPLHYDMDNKAVIWLEMKMVNAKDVVFYICTNKE